MRASGLSGIEAAFEKPMFSNCISLGVMSHHSMVSGGGGSGPRRVAGGVLSGESSCMDAASTSFATPFSSMRLPQRPRGHTSLYVFVWPPFDGSSLTRSCIEWKETNFRAWAVGADEGFDKAAHSAGDISAGTMVSAAGGAG